jgi:ubiquinone/menaquinone biosynthesis C-methylase UbiE
MPVFRRVGSAGLVLPACLLLSCPVAGQEKSVRPGINKPFENPDVKQFIATFEGESRDIFAKRKEIVAACKIKPGMSVGDIGAGTGLFTRLFAAEVGPKGRVYAVDIARNFIEHIKKTCEEAGIKNATPILCTQTSTELPASSIDLAFICDTYHHFEFPAKTLASIHKALRPGGRLVLIDFRRGKAAGADVASLARMVWIMNHVRAGQDVFTQELVTAGFRQVEEKQLMKENYFLVFEKVEKKR